MEQYIPKSALVAEIQRLHKAHSGRYGCDEVGLNLEYLEDFINTLEVKEVDLDDKDEWKNTGGFGSAWDPDSPDYCPD